MKMAVFQIVNSGIDGLGKEVITFSSLCEIERDKFFDALGKNKCYYSKNDKVLDLKQLGKNLLSKLDGNDHLVLRECLNFDKLTDGLSFPHHDINIEVYSPKIK